MLKSFLKYCLFFVHLPCFSQYISQVKKADSVYIFQSCSQGSVIEKKFKPKDIETYQPLKEYYAKDKYYIYYYGEIIEDADVETFNTNFYLIDSNYGKRKIYFGSDAYHIYYKDKLITGADKQSFQFAFPQKSLLIYKDKSHVFLEEKTIPRANPRTIELIDLKLVERGKNYKYHYYFKDDQRVYFNNQLMPYADVSSFVTDQGVKWPSYIKRDRRNIALYAADKNYYYRNGTIIFINSLNIPNSIQLFSNARKAKKPVILIKEYNPNKNDDDNKLLYTNDISLIKKLTLKRVYNIKKIIPTKEVNQYYTISYYNGKSIQRYYYNSYDQELDKGELTDRNVAGDGYYWSKEEFENLIEKCRSYYIKTDTLSFFKKLLQIQRNINNDPKIIYSYWDYRLFPNDYGISNDSIVEIYDGQLTFEQDIKVQENFFKESLKSLSENMQKELNKIYPNDKFLVDAVSEMYNDNLPFNERYDYLKIIYNLYCSEPFSKNFRKYKILAPFERYKYILYKYIKN